MSFAFPPYFQPATPKQQDVLYDLLPPGHWPKIPAMSKQEAHAIISQHVSNAQSPPSAKQEKFLRSRGRWEDGMNRGEASKLIGDLIRQENAARKQSSGRHKPIDFSPQIFNRNDVRNPPSQRPADEQ